MALFLEVKQEGAFVAHCTASWVRKGYEQTSDKEQDAESMTAGTNWSVTLPDDVSQLVLHVEHDTGLVWNPRNVTYNGFWNDPMAEFGSDGKLVVRIYGTTLIGYGGEVIG